MVVEEVEEVGSEQRQTRKSGRERLRRKEHLVARPEQARKAREQVVGEPITFPRHGSRQRRNSRGMEGWRDTRHLTSVSSLAFPKS